MSSLVLVAPPSEPPITLQMAKRHLRVSDGDDDSIIAAYIDAAVAHAESFMGRSLVDQTWDYTIDVFPRCPYIELPRPPILEVIEFDSGESPAFDGYEVDLAGGRIYLSSGGSWPSTSANANVARIRYRAGYVDKSGSPEGDVPADIVSAVLLIVGTLYEHRETVVIGGAPAQMPWSAEQLLRRHRVELGMA